MIGGIFYGRGGYNGGECCGCFLSTVRGVDVGLVGIVIGRDRQR